MIQGWALNTIANNLATVNTTPQHTHNCYYCTAAALNNMDVLNFVSQTGVMQDPVGSEDHFLQLIPGSTMWRFDSVSDARQFLIQNLANSTAVAVGYNRIDGTAHMVIAFKDAEGYLYNTDYQAVPPSTSLGIRPMNENPFSLTNCCIFHPTEQMNVQN